MRLVDVDKGTLHLPDREVKEGKVKPEARASRYAFLSGDGRLALVRCLDHSLGLYHAEQGNPIRTFQKAPNLVHNPFFLRPAASS